MSLVFSLFSEEIPVHFQNSAKVFRVSVEEKFRWISRDKLFTKAQDVPWVLVEKHFDDFSTLSTIFGHFHHTLFYFHTFTFTFTWVLVGKNYDGFSTLFTFSLSYLLFGLCFLTSLVCWPFDISILICLEIIRESQFFISMKCVKNREIEIQYTSNSHITSWQSQSLRNRSPNKVEVFSWDWERPGFCIYGLYMIFNCESTSGSGHIFVIFSCGWPGRALQFFLFFYGYCWTKYIFLNWWPKIGKMS